MQNLTSDQSIWAYRILNPITVFLFIWFIQIFFYSLGLSAYLPTDLQAELTIASLFFISVLAFISGYALVNAWGRRRIRRGLRRNQSHMPAVFALKGPGKSLNGMIATVLVIATAVSLWNIVKYGPPPLFIILYHMQSKYNYLDYGQMKYFIFGPVLLLMSLAPFTRKFTYKLSLIAFSVVILVLFVSRGYLIQGVVQFIISQLLVNRGKLSLGMLIRYVVIFIIFLLVAMTVIGQFRSGTHNFLVGMKIRPSFQSYPAGLLWIISYIGFPLANIVAVYMSGIGGHFGGLLSLHNILPPFLWHVFHVTQMDAQVTQIVHKYFPNPGNNVGTYLMAPYLDYGIWGIVGFNLLIGVVASFLFRSLRHSRGLFYPIVYTMFTADLLMIFFDNFFLNVTNLSEVALFIVTSIIFQRWFEDEGFGEDVLSEGLR